MGLHIDPTWQLHGFNLANNVRTPLKICLIVMFSTMLLPLGWLVGGYWVHVWMFVGVGGWIFVTVKLYNCIIRDFVKSLKLSGNT